MRKVRMIVSSLAAAGLVMTVPVTAGASQSQGACESERYVVVTNYSSSHLPVGKVFKNGPGGTVTTSQTISGTASSTISGGSSATLDLVIAEVGANVEGSVTESQTVSHTGTYTRNISSGKYGNMQFGAWSHSVDWESRQRLPDCSSSYLASGTAEVAEAAEGWRYWETSA